MIRPHAAFESREDLALVRSALADDPRAIETLIDRLECVPRILAAINYEMACPLNAHDIEDLAQDTLLKVLAKLESFEGRARLESWAYRFCYLEFHNRRRRESLRTVRPIEREPAIEPESRFEEEAEFARIEELLEVLGPPKSHVIQLRHFEDLSFEEIGRVLGMPGNTARTHYHRGLIWLRGELGRMGKGRRA